MGNSFPVLLATFITLIYAVNAYFIYGDGYGVFNIAVVFLLAGIVGELSYMNSKDNKLNN